MLMGYGPGRLAGENMQPLLALAEGLAFLRPSQLLFGQLSSSPNAHA